MKFTFVFLLVLIATVTVSSTKLLRQSRRLSQGKLQQQQKQLVKGACETADHRIGECSAACNGPSEDSSACTGANEKCCIVECKVSDAVVGACQTSGSCNDVVAGAVGCTEPAQCCKSGLSSPSPNPDSIEEPQKSLEKVKIAEAEEEDPNAQTTTVATITPTTVENEPPKVTVENSDNNISGGSDGTPDILDGVDPSTTVPLNTDKDGHDPNDPALTVNDEPNKDGAKGSPATTTTAAPSNDPCLPTEAISATVVSGEGTDTVAYTASVCGSTITFTEKTIRGKPLVVNNYEGNNPNMLVEADFTSVGYSSSAYKIFQANAALESGRKWGIINTWDDQFISWGAPQFACKSTTLITVLCLWRRTYRAEFEAYLGKLGVKCPLYDDENQSELPGWRSIIKVGTPTTQTETTAGCVYDRTKYSCTTPIPDDACKTMKESPSIIAALMLAGNNKNVVKLQIIAWHKIFYEAGGDNTYIKFEDKDKPKKDQTKHKVFTIVTSEFAFGVVSRLTNWKQNDCKSWVKSCLAQMDPTEANASDKSTRDTYFAQGAFTLTTAGETAFLTCLISKSGRDFPLDTFGPSLSKEPGSLVY